MPSERELALQAKAWPFEEARIRTVDGLDLQGWFFPAQGTEAGPARTILFMHGTSYNASDMWLTDERQAAFQDFLAGIRANFLLFDYRGYGCNAGRASEHGTYLDAQAALEWVRARPDVDPDAVFFYGFSLGTSVAAELARRERCAGLILRAPFTSLRDMIVDWDARFRFALTLAPWLPLTRYDTLSKVRQYGGPLLVMHGEADNTVPEWMGQRVFEASPSAHKTYVQFPGSGHADIAADLVVPPITQFMDRCQSSVVGRRGRAGAGPDAASDAVGPPAVQPAARSVSRRFRGSGTS